MTFIYLGLVSGFLSLCFFVSAFKDMNDELKTTIKIPEGYYTEIADIKDSYYQNSYGEKVKNKWNGPIGIKTFTLISESAYPKDQDQRDAIDARNKREDMKAYFDKADEEELSNTHMEWSSDKKSWKLLRKGKGEVFSSYDKIYTRVVQFTNGKSKIEKIQTWDLKNRTTVITPVEIDNTLKVARTTSMFSHPGGVGGKDQIQ